MSTSDSPIAPQRTWYASSISHQRQADICGIEYHNNRDPHLPAVEVPRIQVSIVPTHREVVNDSKDPGRSDSVVSTDVGDDGDFGGEFGV